MQDDWQISPLFHLNSAASYTDYSRRTRSTRHDFTNNTDELTTGIGEQDTAVFTTLFFRSQGHYIINKNYPFSRALNITATRPQAPESKDRP
ncbi:hypothetical protein KRR40_09175 [Niabella defluvii]|nr:hypothetical protein KRR40_09175 [Niabella sp. I65]